MPTPAKPSSKAFFDRVPPSGVEDRRAAGARRILRREKLGGFLQDALVSLEKA